jgi:hypothetical protein
MVKGKAERGDVKGDWEGRGEIGKGNGRGERRR